ncbi:TIGR02302 family protein [Zavarzinia sp.]|uniref:TIGR02302 family protein n=1 Tax=Zavarzinia sp. TaxID=2027920 RepID=UPI00356946A5
MTGGDGRLARRLLAARLVLAFEALWPALWPGLGVIGTFAALALAGVFEHVSPVVHAILLGLFGLALVVGWRRVPAALRLPDTARARRRLERDNALPHRALETLDDRLAAGAGDPASQALWQAHLARVAARVQGLRVGGPHAGLVRHDPHALRAAVILALVVAGIAAGSAGPERLAEALVPRFAPAGGAPAGSTSGYTAWITPPAYTRLPPVYLGGQGIPPGQHLRVAAGSKLMARIYGAGAGTVAFGDQVTVLDTVEAGTFAGEVPVTAAPTLRLLDGESEWAAWPLEIVPDAPPVVAFASPPVATERRALRIAFDARDDYGVSGVALVIRLPGNPEPLTVPLGGATGRPEAKGTAFKDLTAHPWAGLDVAAELVATDALGQTGRSDSMTFALPERSFRHPVARAIVAARKALVQHPDERRKVATVLAAIADQTDAYEGRVSVFLGLDLAVTALIRHGDGSADASVVDLLWEIALDLDQGRVPSAEAALRAAQDALEQALQNGASDAEVARLMDELRQAMADYLQALTEEAMRNGGEMQAQQATPDGRVLTPEDLQRMIDEAQKAAEGGSREAARKMLSELRDMLENLQAMPGQAQDGATQALNQGMNQLGGMLRDQGRLRDQSFAEQQRRQDGGARQPGAQGQQRPGQGQAGQQGQPGGLGGQAQEQEDLRRQLGDLLRQLGDAGLPLPESLTQAERAMDRARQALEGDDPGAAAQAQGEALSALREGLQNLGEQMAQQLGTRRGQGAAGNEPGGERDPLGRPKPGRDFGSGDEVKVPTEAEAKRVREILDELQRRAGDRSRTPEELDYIRRLLERF